MAIPILKASNATDRAAAVDWLRDEIDNHLDGNGECTFPGLVELWADAKRGAEVRRGEGRAQVVDDKDIEILRFLAEHPEKWWKQSELEAASVASRHTLVDHMKKLLEAGLIVRPKPRKGVTISLRGLRLLQRLVR
jgi:hypothetical protein